MSFYKGRGVLRTVLNVFDGALWRKAKNIRQICGKLISRKLETNLRKLVLRDVTQLKARLQSQLKSISTGISSKSKNLRKCN